MIEVNKFQCAIADTYKRDSIGHKRPAAERQLALFSSVRQSRWACQAHLDVGHKVFSLRKTGDWKLWNRSWHQVRLRDQRGGKAHRFSGKQYQQCSFVKGTMVKASSSWTPPMRHPYLDGFKKVLWNYCSNQRRKEEWGPHRNYKSRNFALNCK